MKYNMTKNRLESIYTLLIVLLPILHIYAVPRFGNVLSLGELLLILTIPFLVVALAMRGMYAKMDNPFFLYLFYALVSTIIISLVLCFIYSQFSLNSMINRVLRDIYYMMLIVVFGKEFFNFELGVKYIKIIAIILSAFIICQFILYSVFGVYVSGFIPGVKTTISGGAFSNEIAAKFLLAATYDGIIRCNGFLAEPASAGHFLSVALLIFLFPTNKKSIDFKKAIVVSLAMVLTFSANAFVALTFCWIWWLLTAKKRYREAGDAILILIACGIIIPFAAKNNLIQGVFSRVTGLFAADNNTQNSASVRVLRGWAFYIKMPVVNQIFGSGFGNFIEFKEALNISTVYEHADEYLNTNAYVAISSGLIGLVLYIYGIWKAAILSNQALTKSLALLLFIYGMSSSIYSSAPFVIILLLIFNCPKKEFLDDKNNNIA